MLPFLARRRGSVLQTTYRALGKFGWMSGGLRPGLLQGSVDACAMLVQTSRGSPAEHRAGILKSPCRGPRGRPEMRLERVVRLYELGSKNPHPLDPPLPFKDDAEGAGPPAGAGLQSLPPQMMPFSAALALSPSLVWRALTGVSFPC